MATSAGEIEVKLTLNADDFKRGLTQGKSDVQAFNDVLADLGKKLLAVFSFAEIGNFFRESLNAYAENELAVKKLVASLNNQGLATEKNVKALTDMATALQYTTGVQDEAIIGVESLLTTFGIAGDTMKQVTQAALDLSAATGVDLQRAALLLGKAYEGETSSLARYGIVVNSHIETNKRFAAIMDQVNRRFGGEAQALAQTYTGRLNVMKAAFNDLQEAVGSFLAGPAGGLMVWLTSIIRLETESLGAITRASNAMGGLGNVLKVVGIEILRIVVNTATHLIDILLRGIALMPMLGRSVLVLRTDLQSVNKALNDQIDRWQASTQEAMKDESKKQSAVLQTKDVIFQSVDAASTFTKDKMAEEAKLRSKLSEENKQAQIDFARGFIVTTGDMWNFAGTMRDQFFTAFGDNFAQMIVEGKNFTDGMKQAFKSMAESIISYIMQMIAKMLAFLALKAALGAGFGGGMGGAFAAFGGFAEGGMIAEPSIITGLRSGRQILAGENQPELVVPMGGSGSGLHTAAEMGGLPGMGGGSSQAITINISGQFIEGDANSWNKLMRERIIPQIRRFTMVSATGPFNRTRGVV